MRRNYKILSFLLCIALLFSNIAIPVGATGVSDTSVSENAIVVETTVEETTEVVSEVTTELIPVAEVEEAIGEATTDNAETDTVEESVLTEILNVSQEMIEMPSYSETVINPLYQNLISQEELESEIEAIKIQNANSASSVRTYAISHFTTETAVAEYLRGQMVARENTVIFTIPYSLLEANDNFFGDIFAEAIAHTEECSGQEGDALKWGHKGYSLEAGGTYSEFQVTWTLAYHTTAAQEAELTAEVDSIMTNLALDDETEYEKIKAIHDYICDTVDYDYTYSYYSAYEALCNKSAVCQGYAIAFYRLCKEADLSVRLISGIGNGGAHGWNIVKIGNVYYNIDCTWDGQGSTTYWNYFLLNETDFVNHTRDEEYDTEAFHVQYPMTVYSYGDEDTQPLNLANLEYSFTTIDDEVVSSVASGKPKLLIFFNVSCPNSMSTIKSVADYELAGVDIYAIDAKKNEKSAVEEFKNTYGCDDITFSYDTTSANSSAMWSYLRAVDPSVTSTTFPVVCYIDANNKFQFVTTAKSSGAQISANLQRYCGYTELVKEYSITYHLDGGTNHEDNPETFTSKTATITLKDPSKNGYAFKGWYSDADYTNQVTQIEKGTKENIVLYAKFVKELELQIPNKTTYIIEEPMDVTGGTVTHGESGKSEDLTLSMISGFDSTEEGVCTVTVTYQGCSTTFEVLIVESVGELTADYGKVLADVELPTSEYGTYSWSNAEQKLDKVGENTYSLTFTPNDALSFSVRADIETGVSVYRTISGTVDIRIEAESVTYNGQNYFPSVEVLLDGSVMETDDYKVEYSNNKNAGQAMVTITGQNYYKGSENAYFTIQPAKLTITAADMTITVGDELPVTCAYKVEGLAQQDSLITEPSFTFTATDTTQTGLYDIVPSGATASTNYNPAINYVNGKLLIAEELVGYTVTFDVQGHGIAPENYVGVKAGGIIEKPENPIADGYIFDGWFKDAECTKEWNFDTDVVQENTVLYAKWNVIKEEINFSVSEISDVTYTGKALKPAVKVYDGDTLLKANKDYKITYYNNINVNTVKSETVFDEKLPYVVIAGKGNYTDTIKINFNILPAVIGNGSETPATGVKVSCSEQLVVNTKKAVNPFKSISFGRKMKKDVDYTVTLTASNAKGTDGIALSGIIENGMIPAGSSGTFILTITGSGNYSGSINKTVVVTDKTHLIKNAKISLGKNIKKIDFDYYQNELRGSLPVAYYDNVTKKYYAVANGAVDYGTELNANDVFTVKCGNTSLIYQKDFTVQYQNDEKTGKATILIVGMGSYLGNKSTTFTLTGKAFNTKTVTVDGIEKKNYTGKPVTQNDVMLTYKDGTKLTYGTDYTISYAKHINKGKATMTFTAKGDSGYQGSFKKTFNIDAASITDDFMDMSMLDISVEYDKAGVKPAEKVILRNAAGILLVNGKDYTLSYENNKKVADKNAEKAPTIVIKGKGNYAGAVLRVPFTITKAALDSEKIKVTLKELAYNAKKADHYLYKPTVKVADGKKALSANKDYKMEYYNNTQADYRAFYIDKTVSGEDYMPRVVISSVEDSNYVLSEPIVVPLPIYQVKLTKNKLHIVVSTGEYTGTQVSPEIAVYYSDDAKVVKSAKGMTQEEEILALGLVKLTPDRDYTVSYGTNITAGKNKGVVTINGKSPEYGGKVSVKFNIDSKKIVW